MCDNMPMLSVEQQNRRTNVQLGILTVGCAGMLVALYAPPIWALYCSAALAGLQAFLVSTLVALLRASKSPPYSSGRSLTGMRSVDRVNGYVQEPRERWENTNEFLQEES